MFSPPDRRQRPREPSSLFQARNCGIGIVCSFSHGIPYLVDCCRLSQYVSATAADAVLVHTRSNTNCRATRSSSDPLLVASLPVLRSCIVVGVLLQVQGELPNLRKRLPYSSISQVQTVGSVKLFLLALKPWNTTVPSCGKCLFTTLQNG